MVWSSVNPLMRWPLGFTCRRTLFTFPKFPDLSSWGGQETQTYHESKILPYGQEELYNVVADVASYPRFIPFCTESQIVKPPKQIHVAGTHPSPFVMEAELTVGFLAFKERYVSQVTCSPYQSVQAIATSSTPLFRTLSTTWRFQPAPSQRPITSLHSEGLANNDEKKQYQQTLVTLDLAYAFANPLHASVSSAFFGQVSKLMVKAFQDRCLAVYGPRHGENGSN